MTITAAAGVLSAPEPITGPGPGGITDDAAGTVTWADFTAGIGQLERTGLCTHPIRLRGRIDAIDLATGELAPMYNTAAEPGGVLLTACGNRRETVCPACSQIYKRDARQLVRAGLSGGKGIPETITGHPCVFATLTAPSFGPVHARRMRGKTVLPCRPRRDARQRRCPHGRDISCPVRHGEDDPRLGRALCGDCYDYDAAVLFNAYAGDLWRRFTTYLPRHLARLAGTTQAQLRSQVRIRYVKVAEYQARGVVHFHAIIRLDAPGEDYQPPGPRFTADLLSDAIHQAAAAVVLVLNNPGQPARILRFGQPQGTDTKPIRHGDGLPSTGQALTTAAVGNYIAKYATKALDAPGLPDRPIRSRFELDAVRCSHHHKAMMAAAWRLGSPRDGCPRLRKWAHMLGYGGHFLTKSRRYSVTFGQLRRARTEHRRRQHHPHGEHDPWGRPLDERVVLVLKTWAYDGTGYTGTADVQLALASAARAREHDQAANAA